MSTTDSQSPRRKKKQPAPSPVANEHAHEDEGVADEGAADEGAEAKEYVRTPIYSRYRRIVDFFGAWSVSIIVHVILLVILGIWALPEIIKEHVRTLVVVRMEEDLDDEEEFVEVELEKTVEAVEQVSLAVMSSNPVVVGAEGSASDAAAEPTVDQEVTDRVEANDVQIKIADLTVSIPKSEKLLEDVPEGTVGDSRAIVDDYDQAMDRITQELLLMLDRGPVLLIWCFDESESMKDDQEEIRQRIRKVYAELGLTSQAAGDRLLSAVTSYGAGFKVHLRKPTNNRPLIENAIAQIPVDATGEERMCSAVGRAIGGYRDFAKTGKRQLALVLVTDESGHPEGNTRILEAAIAEAKASRCRCYVLGREAVFGYPYAHIRWVHPQTHHHHWLLVDRGPETAFVEQLQIDGFRRRHDAFPSGFGSFEQARLARETGGIFFMLPSLESALVRGEKRRYELEQMRKYRPDLSARIEAFAAREKYPLRNLIWTVISDLNPYNPNAARMIEMRMYFSIVPQTFLQQARQEQQKAQLLLRYYGEAQKALEDGVHLREEEPEPRWRANYDLIHAQLIAYQARLWEYGVALEEFIQNPPIVPLTKQPDLRLVHWDIITQKTVRTEESKPYIERSSQLFEEIKIRYHGTPWAGRADQELKRGFGVGLRADYHRPYRVVPSGVVTIPVPKL
ncbi:MAG: Sec-independent protein translocase protein TatA [Pirellulaceae bacterium]|jgi:Sec-independent protein translocase protein TatA